MSVIKQSLVKKGKIAHPCSNCGTTIRAGLPKYKSLEKTSEGVKSLYTHVDCSNPDRTELPA